MTNYVLNCLFTGFFIIFNLSIVVFTETPYTTGHIIGSIIAIFFFIMAFHSWRIDLVKPSTNRKDLDVIDKYNNMPDLDEKKTNTR